MITFFRMQFNHSIMNLIFLQLDYGCESAVCLFLNVFLHPNRPNTHNEVNVDNFTFNVISNKDSSEDLVAFEDGR